MLQTTQAFLDVCTEMNIKPMKIAPLPDGQDSVIIGIAGKNLTTAQVLCVFDRNERAMAFRIGRIAVCPEEKTVRILDTLNELNLHYRWVTFFIDRNANIGARCDTMLVSDDAGKLGVSMMMNVFHIVDDAYPKLMKAIWAE